MDHLERGAVGDDLVTIVIPAYNSERYIQATVESVQVQRSVDWRLIVVDDGSTDATVSIVERLAASDERITSAKCEHGGPASARNVGFHLADDRTAYFMFLDHDDFLQDSALETLLAALVESPGAVAAYGLADEYDDVRRRSCLSDISEAFGYHRHRVSGRGVVPLAPDDATGFDSFVIWCCISTPGQVLIRAGAIQAVGSFDPSTAWSDDWDLWLRLSSRSEFIFCRRLVLTKRAHGENLSANHDTPSSWGGGLAVRRKMIGADWLTPEQREIARLGWRYEALLKLGWARDHVRSGRVKTAARTVAQACRSYVRYRRAYS